jgi:hypothetical protein
VVDPFRQDDPTSSEVQRNQHVSEAAREKKQSCAGLRKLRSTAQFTIAGLLILS